jgi:hypothetical protein
LQRRPGLAGFDYVVALLFLGLEVLFLGSYRVFCWYRPYWRQQGEPLWKQQPLMLGSV